MPAGRTRRSAKAVLYGKRAKEATRRKPRQTPKAKPEHQRRRRRIFTFSAYKILKCRFLFFKRGSSARRRKASFQKALSVLGWRSACMREHQQPGAVHAASLPRGFSRRCEGGMSGTGRGQIFSPFSARRGKCSRISADRRSKFFSAFFHSWHLYRTKLC